MFVQMAKTNATKAARGKPARSNDVETAGAPAENKNSEADNYTPFRVWMIEERRRQGMTQDDLAEMTGFHKAHISNIERGVRDPSKNLVEAVADAFGINRDDVRVIAGIDEAPPSVRNVPETQTARLNRIRRRAETEPADDLEREEILVMLEAVLDGAARRRRLSVPDSD